MAIKNNISLSDKKMSQEIDLRELLGREPKPVEIASFEEMAVERIIERTQSGKDINGSNFTRYSKDYADAKGVSVNDVDMTLLGDMLLGVKTRRTRGGVEVYLEDDQLPKGLNHQFGDTLPKREWFGLTEKEARDIAGMVREDDEIPAIPFPSFFEQQEEINISEILANIGLFIDQD